MCDCEKEFQKHFIENANYKGRKITKAEFPKMYFMNGSSKLCGSIELTADGLKNTVKRDIVFNYCPFCGEKFPEINQEKSNG